MSQRKRVDAACVGVKFPGNLLCGKSFTNSHVFLAQNLSIRAKVLSSADLP